MEITRRETVYEGKYLRMLKKTAVTVKKQECVWETIERINIFDNRVVVVVPLTGDNEFVMERQWRAAIESYVIQFPAGLMDIENESSEETARRELLEETGYAAGKLVPILAAPTNPVLSPTIAHYYFAPGVEYTGGENRDTGEDIEIITVPRERVGEFLLTPPRDTFRDLAVPGIIKIMEEKGLI
jgi:ADP-ribose pyrophosphatase